MFKGIGFRILYSLQRPLQCAHRIPSPSQRLSVAETPCCPSWSSRNGQKNTSKTSSSLRIYSRISLNIAWEDYWDSINILPSVAILTLELRFPMGYLILHQAIKVLNNKTRMPSVLDELWNESQVCAPWCSGSAISVGELRISVASRDCRVHRDHKHAQSSSFLTISHVLKKERHSWSAIRHCKLAHQGRG